MDGPIGGSAAHLPLFQPARGTDKMALLFKRICACFWHTLRSFGGAPRPCPVAVTANWRARIIVALACAAFAIGVANTRADSFVELDYNIFLSNRIRSTAFIQLFD